MKTITLVCCCLTFLATKAQETLPSVRRLYALAGNSKDSLLALKNLLSNVNAQAKPVFMCYNGATEVVSAKYSYNPFKKYQLFDHGKELVEVAIAKDSVDLEMRFLRFTLQTKLPGFLGYNKNITDDKLVILSGFKAVSDTTLKHLVINFFTSSGCCTPKDIKNLLND